MSVLGFEDAKNKKNKEKKPKIFPNQPKLNLEVGNEVISSEVLTSNISQEMFQGNLQKSIQKGLEVGLLSLVGQ